MTLINLVTRLAREIGLNPQVEAQREILDELVNTAAEELYTQTDLPRSLLEEVFVVDSTDSTERITLPYRCGEIRGIRDWNSKITLHDMRPRYHERPWPAADMYTWRLLGEPPICRSIDNSVALYMAPVDIEALTVTITGRTAEAETLTAEFDENGEGTAQTTLWEDIYSITKSADTAADVVLTVGDADGEEIARIPTTSDSSRYLHIQLIERPAGCETSDVWTTPNRCFDILYKPPFRPLRSDYETFQVTGYDTALLATAVKIWRLRNATTDEQIKAAQIHAARADDLTSNTTRNKIQAQELVVQYGQPRGDSSLLRGLRKNRYR